MNLRFNIATKLVIFISAFVLFAMLISGFSQYMRNKKDILEYLKGGLEILADTGSLLIDGDLHETVWEKKTSNCKEFLNLKNTLLKIYRNNRSKGFKKENLYTLRRVGNKTEFVIMLQDKTFVGHKYQLRKKMLPVLNGKTSVSTDIYTDEHGTWVSAYAPIKNSKNKVVGIFEVDYRIDVFLALLNERISFLIITSILAFFITIIATIIFSRYFVKPIKNLTLASQKVASGNLNVKLSNNLNDEIGDLTKSFNKMVKEIKEKTHLKKLYKELEKTHKELKQLTRMKEDFFAVASHDLRSPFNGILGFSELLLDDPKLKKEHKEIIELIYESTKTQLDYINDILEILELENGEIKLDLQIMNISKIIEISMNTLSILAKKKNINLIYEKKCKKPKCKIAVDKPKIIQVLNNLISNAIKFTPSNGDIKVTCFINNNKDVEVHVKDTGVGIPSEKIHTLFSRYNPAQTSGTHGEKGTGLGLAICKNLVELHGGSIDVKSVVGEGSDFYFTLPQKQSMDS